MLAHIEGIKGSVFPPSIRSNPHPHPRPTPLAISSQPIVTLRQKSRLALVASRSLASASGQERRAQKSAEDEAAKAEARKKGKTAYFTVNIIKGTTMRFQWKDKKGIIWSVDDVTFKPGWDLDRVEFEAKLAYDTYWDSESGQYRHLGIPPTQTPSLPNIDVSIQPTAGRGSRALAQYLHASNARGFENTNPSRVFGPFSEFARNILETNKKEWPGVVQAWEEKRNDPDAFAVNITKHKQAFRKLMEHAVSHIGLAIATPVSLVEAVTACDGGPQGNGPQGNIGPQGNGSPQGNIGPQGNGPLGNGGHELPEYIDPELTQEHVLRDIHVLPDRPAGQHVTKHTQLTSHEKVMLFLVFQRLRDTANPPYRLTVSDWQSFFNALFDNWNSRFDPPADPELPARQSKQTQLDVATLNQDHPPSMARQRAGDAAGGNLRYLELFSDFATFEKQERKLFPDLAAFRYRKELPGGITDDEGEGNERQTLSCRALSDSDELTAEIVSNDHSVANFRDPDSFANTHAVLTAREKDIIFVMLQPIRKTAEPPFRLTWGYWNSILKKLFDDWNTKLQAPLNPFLPDRIKEHTYIKGGTLKSDQPLPNSKRRACRTVPQDYRTRGAEARIGVYINPDTNSISFPWTRHERKPCQRLKCHIQGRENRSRSPSGREQSSSSLEIWFLPEEPFEHHNWSDILANLQVSANPYAEYLTDVRSKYTDLTHKNIGALDPDSRPDRATPSTAFFFGGEHRTVTLIAEPSSFRIRSLHAWQPQDDDLETYGIPAGGTLKGHHLVHYMDPEIASGVPDAGSSCTFFMDISWRDRQLRKADLTPQQIARITRDLTNRFHFAEQKFINVGASIEQKIQTAAESDDTDRVEYLEENKKRKYLEAFVTTAAEPIYHLLKGPSAKAAADLPDQPPSLQRAATAEALSLDLRRRDGEDDLVYCFTPSSRSTGPQVSRSPIWTSRNQDPGSCDYCRAKLPYPGVEVNLYHRPEETTARTECNAITNINARAKSVNETIVGGFWKFPGLARACAEEKFDGEVKGLVERLKETPYGYAFVTGVFASQSELTVAVGSESITSDKPESDKPESVTSDKPDPVASDKPESTGWMDDDNDDACSETSFCSAVSYLAVGPGSDQLEQEHIIGARSFDIRDDTTLPSDHRVLPTKGGPNLEFDGLRSLVDSPEYTQMMAISQGSGSSNMSVDELACVLKLRSERQGSIPLQLAAMIDGNPPASVPISISLNQDRFEQTYKEQVFWLYFDHSPANFRNLLIGHNEISHPISAIGDTV
ncbi:hypothetical protein FPANT_8968 [Fusarium pseudoanthophilum]|uniref:Uncharacterized protein n=1 Tax=Fusarium pseudoanthophilum TaxID=48495 RepID=A0A8H5KVH7_9HYPO|nr:hypothetical protein FPANT_8968 [Fusarium pseudoanthophilum]